MLSKVKSAGMLCALMLGVNYTHAGMRSQSFFHRIENRLAKTINIVMRFDKCKTKSFNLNPGQTSNTHSTCCLTGLEIYELNRHGARTGRATIFNIGLTGISRSGTPKSCKSNNLYVTEGGPRGIQALPLDI